ncbi:MAG: helix-turn-helix domain-containing protein [Halieaceae bacterium]|nr:helix-turn-helix domain-containing protein [Halieaceae bacterium]
MPATSDKLQPIEPLWRVERRVIEQAIARCDGNVRLAARYLQVAPSTLYRKIQAWQESSGD